MNDFARPTAHDKTAVRPFHVSIPEAELAEMRKRIKATRWPERETVTDESQGVKLSMMQDLARSLLGVRLRLAQGRITIERAAAVHH